MRPRVTYGDGYVKQMAIAAKEGRLQWRGFSSRSPAKESDWKNLTPDEARKLLPHHRLENFRIKPAGNKP